MPSKLLIADDNTTFQKVFERTFPREEFAITFVKNGKEGLAKAREDKPDLIIADINMPLMNGFEVCEEVKNDPHLKGTPVLLLIGILDDFDEDESRRVGADGFITKPFEANAAISKVREVLTLREGATALEKAVEEIPPLKGVVEEAVKETVEEAVPREEAVKEEEEVVELEEVVEEPVAAAPPAIEEKKEEIGLERPLRELEAELKEEFPEEKVQKKEEPLTLDLPLDEMETEPVTRGAEAPGLFEELGVGEARGETEAEKSEAIPNETAPELERIEGLTPEKEEKQVARVEEFEEQFMKTSEPVFEPKEDGYERIGTLEKDSERVSKEAIEGLVERLTTMLSHEVRKAVEEVIEEKVPTLLRQEVERLRSD